MRTIWVPAALLILAAGAVGAQEAGAAAPAAVPGAAAGDGEAAPGPETPVASPGPGAYEAGARRFIALGVPDVSKCRLVAITGPAWSSNEPVWLVEEDAATGALRIWTRDFAVQTVPKSAAGLSREDRALAYTRYREVDARVLAGKYAREKLDSVKWQAAERFFFAVALYSRGMPAEADALVERIFRAFDRGEDYERKDRAEVISGFYAELGLRRWRGALEQLFRKRDWKAAAADARALAAQFPAWRRSAELTELAAAMDRTASRGTDYLPESARELPGDMQKLLRELAVMDAIPDMPEPAIGGMRAGHPAGRSKRPENAFSVLAGQGLAAFPALLTVVEDDTCCLAGLADGGGGADYGMPGRRMGWSGDEALPLPRPMSRGELAWLILQRVMPRGGAGGRGRGGLAARPDADELRAWYRAHRDLDAEKMTLVYLAEGDAGQMMQAARRLLAADKARHRDAVGQAALGFEAYERVGMLAELAKLDRDLAVPMLQDIAAGSERWPAEEARKVLRRLKVKSESPPKPVEGPAESGGDEEAEAGDRAGAVRGE